MLYTGDKVYDLEAVQSGYKFQSTACHGTLWAKCFYPSGPQFLHRDVTRTQ